MVTPTNPDLFKHLHRRAKWQRDLSATEIDQVVHELATVGIAPLMPTLSALLTKAFGADFTQRFTDAHEMDPNPVQTAERDFMDRHNNRHNNRLGIEIAQHYPSASDEEIANFIIEAL